MRCRLLHRKGLAIIFTLFLVLNIVQPAAADIGPGSLLTANGSNILPGTQTRVRMDSERVEIDIQAAVSEEGRDASFALVTALFNMRNLGENSETMRVKFPLNDGTVAGMSGDEIKCFQAWVNGEPAEVVFGGEPADLPTSILTSWVYFQATFPPGDLVPIRVSYLLQPREVYLSKAEGTTSSSDKEISQSYAYLLVTGRDWSGTIGRAEIGVNFPYPVDPANVTRQPAGSRLAGNQVTWVKEDFEPSEVDNYSIQIVPPTEWLKKTGAHAAAPVVPSDLWMNMLMAQMGVERSQEDMGAKLWLADTYRQMALLAAPDGSKTTFSDTFADLGIATYQKAFEYPQGRRAAYLGAAELMLSKAAPDLTIDERDAIQSALNRAQAIPPEDQAQASQDQIESENQHIEKIVRALQNFSPEGIILPALSPTPTLPPADTALPANPGTVALPASVTPPPTVIAALPQAQAQEESATPGMTPGPGVSPANGEANLQGWMLAAGILGVSIVLVLGYRKIKQLPRGDQ